MNTSELLEHEGLQVPAQHSPMLPARFLLSKLSIKHRLPLLIGALLCGIIITATWVSYLEVKKSAQEVGHTRLRFLSQQLAGMFQQSSANLASKTTATASDPVIRAYLHSPAAPSQAESPAILKQFLPPQDPQSLQVELWRADGSRMLTLPEGSLQMSADLTAEFKQSAAAPLFSAVGTIRIVNDLTAYPVVAAVKGAEGQPLGYLVRWRKIAATAAARQQFIDLIGTEASLYFGNNQGDVWTDLMKAAPKPPVDVRAARDIVHYKRDRQHTVAALARPVGGTPWFLLVEFSDQTVLAQANRFLWRMTMIGALLVATGLAMVLVLSRNITRPLHSLTEAASAISSGDYSHLVSVQQNDEMGALARAFNAMVVKVRDSQHELEREVQERTLLLEAAPCAMLIVDQRGRVSLANSQAEYLFGYTQAELLEQPVDMLIPERYRANPSGDGLGFFQHPTSLAMGTGRDLYGLRKDGSEFPVEIGLNPLETEHGMMMLSTIVDITERKQAEARQAKLEVQLRQSQKMEAIGTLAGGIAHDFNNMLGVVMGYTELAQGDLPSDHAAQSNLAQVMEASNRAKDLVQQILTFSRQQEHDHKPIRLQPVLKETLKLLRATIPSTVEIRQQLDPQTPAILGDPTQIHQVMMNLGTNAWHAMGERGGVIEVTLTSIEVDADLAQTYADLHEGRYLRLVVSDTGQGMDRATLERIYEPFFTTKAPGEGTGLGLAVVHGAVKRHGGAISVYSELGRGTTFNLYFPALESDAVSAEPASASCVNGGGARILFVDDEKSLAILGQKMLERMGHQVTINTNSVEALEVFRAQPNHFDLVITDQTMPLMSGSELAKTLLEIRPDLPILLVTGYSTTINPERAQMLGIRELLMKPNTAQSLGEAIHRALTNRTKE